MNDPQLFSSFMMLNEHLYKTFVQYILNGRTRSPPEIELIEMLPTFQFGAKTDRKALQSKFKSWSKRMKIENGCLVLNTGKIIIPREKCDNLVMHIHSTEHFDVEYVISQIRKSYTWTRKNFGMDRDIVVESIMRNCKRKECMKKIRLEAAKLGNSFCSGMLNFHVPEISFGMPPPLPYYTAYHYPVPFHIPTVFPSRGFPYEFSNLQNMHFLGNPNISINKSNTTLINQKNDLSEPNIVPEIDGKIKNSGNLVAHHSGNDIKSTEEKEQSSKFKKPKNAYEYDVLMKAVRKHPKVFPKILRSKKNQFLSSLGIAPKIICTARTLRKFRHDLRYKKFMNRECMIYKERKMLRDKNKLNKRSLQKKQRTYLEVSFPRKSTSTLSEQRNSTISALFEQRNFVANAEKKPMYGQNNVVSGSKRIKLSTVEKKESVEVITIDTSDEEKAETKDILPKEVQEEDLKQADKNSSIPTASCGQSMEKTGEPSCSILTDVKHSDEHDSPNKLRKALIEGSDNFDGHEIRLKQDIKDKSEIAKSETSQSDVIVSQKLQNTVLNNEFSLLSNKYNNFASNNPSPGDLKSHFRNKFIPIPQFAVIQPITANTKVTDSTTYLVPKMNPTPMVVKRAATLHPQQSTTFPASKQNNITRVVYPINLVKPSNIVVIDNKPQAACFVIPPSLVQQNNASLQTVSPKSSSASTSSAEISSPVQQKLKTTENDIVGNYRKLLTTGDSSKIDINEEMARVANWIYRLKSILNPCMLNNELEKSVQKILSQLDLGIHLVREAKKSLKEIENIIDNSNSSVAAAD